MRISPITMTYNRQNLRPQNQNNRQQNVSFGKFQDETAKKLAYEYLRVDSGDSWCKEAFDYLDETEFVTIKSATSRSTGKPFIYAVAERSAIDKHKNKGLFDKMLKGYEIYKEINRNKEAVEMGLADEPGFLTVVEDFSGTHNIYEDFSDCEEGLYLKTYPSSFDKSKPVESNMEKAWELYGTRN